MGDIKSLIALKHLRAYECKNLKELPNNLSGLTSLEKLNIEGCNNLETFGGLKSLTSLNHLRAYEYTNLKGFPNELSGLTNLEELSRIKHVYDDHCDFDLNSSSWSK